jgi:hypothetical protein
MEDKQQTSDSSLNFVRFLFETKMMMMSGGGGGGGVGDSDASVYGASE